MIGAARTTGASRPAAGRRSGRVKVRPASRPAQTGRPPHALLLRQSEVPARRRPGMTRGPMSPAGSKSSARVGTEVGALLAQPASRRLRWSQSLRPPARSGPAHSRRGACICRRSPGSGWNRCEPPHDAGRATGGASPGWRSSVRTRTAAGTWPRFGGTGGGPGASEDPDGSAGSAPTVRVESAVAIGNPCPEGAGGEARRIDVGVLGPLGQVQRQGGFLDGGDRSVEEVEFGVSPAGIVQ